MKVLLDENLPNKLLRNLSGHDVYTSRKMGWLGFKNGALIKLMLENGFDALITFDKNIQYQQNFAKYPITVFILIAEKNTFEKLSPLIPKVEEHLKGKLIPGAIIIT
jgi:hypothetical protein